MTKRRQRDRNRTATDLRRYDQDTAREGPFSRASREWEIVVPARKKRPASPH